MVGGGVIGVACALALARRGVAVALLEAARLAAGASGRNAGFAIGTPRELDQLRATMDEEGIDASYSEPGHLALATSDEVIERFAADVARRPPGDLELLDRGECEERLGRRIDARFRGGRWQPRAGVVDPVRLVHGLAAAAVRRGATVVEGCRVLALEGDGPLTRSGRLSAEHVVVACNAGTGRLVPELAGRLIATRGQMLVTAPRDREFDAGMGVDFGSVYWRQTGDGRLVAGGCRDADPVGETVADERLNPTVQAAVERFLPRAFPGVATVRAVRRWAGVMDAAPDGAPVLGRVGADRNVWVAAGFAGHGIPPALDAGEALARAIVDGAPPAVLDRLGPARLVEDALR